MIHVILFSLYGNCRDKIQALPCTVSVNLLQFIEKPRASSLDQLVLIA
jgi:hypothetical protein